MPLVVPQALDQRIAAADEPRNAHAHPMALRLGNQLSLPALAGRLAIGRWPSPRIGAFPRCPAHG